VSAIDRDMVTSAAHVRFNDLPIAKHLSVAETPRHCIGGMLYLRRSQLAIAIGSVVLLRPAAGAAYDRVASLSRSRLTLKVAATTQLTLSPSLANPSDSKVR
jgi:hypothetical protein